MNTRTYNLGTKIKGMLGEDVKKILTKIIFPWRNDFMLLDYSNKALNNRVNLNYWDAVDNLGDAISPIIVNWMLSLRGILPEKHINKKKHLYAVGSILTAGIQDATVWGSGVLRGNLLHRLEKRNLDIRAVRGPLTRTVLLDYGYDVPEVYGDPAILMPEIYVPNNKEKIMKYGVILHHTSELQRNALSNSDKNVLVIDIRTNDYMSFLDQLNSVDVVISQSLHGIILAEGYGIKAVLLKPQSDFFKYYDYYYGTERMHFPIAETIEEAMNLIPPSLPNFNFMREKLKESFPYDIYE